MGIPSYVFFSDARGFVPSKSYVFELRTEELMSVL